MQILLKDYKNVVFLRDRVVKDICVELARYIQDSFRHYFSASFFETG